MTDSLSRPLRVALLTAAPLNSHGWGRYTRSMVSELARRDVEITLITSVDAPATPDLPIQRYHRILPSLTPSRRFVTPRMLAAALKVRRLVAGCDCDIVHVVAEPYVLAAALTPMPTVVTAHGTYLPRTVKRRASGAVYRRLYQRAQIICVSNYTAKRVRTALPSLPDAQLMVVPNGVDVTRYQRVPAHLPEKSGPTVLAVGQVKARKGFHILAEAMPLVRKVIPDAQAVFIGDTSADPNYVASIKAKFGDSSGINGIKWLGKAPEDVLMGWFHTADVFALPALNVDDSFEGFGLVYLEASAAGLPVIGSYDCGAEDAIRDGETGFLVAQGNPQALADKLIILLNDPNLRARMGRVGQRLASEYTWARAADLVLAVYEGLRKVNP